MYNMILKHLIIPESENAINGNRVSNERRRQAKEAPIQKRHNDLISSTKFKETKKEIWRETYELKR